MAEVLAIVESIITVIQLTGEVTALGYGYINGVRRASKDIGELLSELGSLSKVLITLQHYADAHPTQSTALNGLNEIEGPLQKCSQELKELQVKLEPRKGWKGKINSIIWPLSEKETMQFISRIERHKSLFMLALDTDQIALSREIHTHVRETKTIAQNIQNDFQTESAARDARRMEDEILRKEKKRKKALNWLYSEPFDTKHSEIRKKRQKDTSEWIFQTPEFEKLIDDQAGPKYRLLWGYGIPGAGKTFISSAVIDHLETLAGANNYGMAYVYFDYKEQDQQRPLRVLASLVKQLACRVPVPHLPAEIEALYDSLSEEKKKPTLEQLYATLVTTSKSFERVFFVFDALDECDEENQRMELLPLLHRMGNDNINIFLTSRKYPEDIQDSLGDGPQIELAAHEQDIRKYVEERINQYPRAKRLLRQGKFKETIISGLVDCAKGMFLLVRFHIEFLCQQTTARQIVTELEKLKNFSTNRDTKPLDPTYDRVLENIHKQPKNCEELALKVLSWLVKAKRLLTVNEIRIAVSVEPNRYELDKLDLPDMATLLDVCAGLVIIDEETNTIRLAHYTVQEYIVRKSILPEDAEFNLAMTCTTYLSFEAFAQGISSLYSGCSEYRDVEKLHPFFDYAVTYLCPHIKACDEHSTADMVMRLLDSPSNLLLFTKAIFHKMAHEFMCIAWIEHSGKPSPLYLACFIGHYNAVATLLENETNLSELSNRKENLLHPAAELGHEEVVRLLLEKGCAISGLNAYGMNALHMAAERGHQAVAQLLLDKGSAISDLTKSGVNALHLAAEGGHEAVVRLLLEKGSTISDLDKGRNNALHLAARWGHGAVVRLLLDKGSAISDLDGDGMNALHLAAQWGHQAVVQLLLEKGCTISGLNAHGMNALHMAAERGHQAVVQLLLEKGSAISDLTKSGMNALHLAAGGGRQAVVQLLLDKGSAISDLTKSGMNALHLAAQWGHQAVAQLLLEKGSVISDLDGDGMNALHLAAQRGHQAVVLFLLDKGSAISDLTKSGMNALHLAAERGHQAVAQLLLEKGSAISDLTKSGMNALHLAAGGGRQAVVQLLLEKGSAISDLDKSGMNALHLAAERGHQAVTQLLLDKGSAISDLTKSGMNALHLAAEGGHEAVVRLLLEKGSVISDLDKSGKNALNIAAMGLIKEKKDFRLPTLPWEKSGRQRYEDVILMVLSKHIPVSATDDDGMTALDILRPWFRKDDKIIQLLESALEKEKIQRTLAESQD